jgi:hypothetical protein
MHEPLFGGNLHYLWLFFANVFLFGFKICLEVYGKQAIKTCGKITG